MVVKICGPLKITDSWLEVNAEEVRMVGLPFCMHCGKRCQKGSYADHHFPHYSEFSFHVRCMERARVETDAQA